MKELESLFISAVAHAGDAGFNAGSWFTGGGNKGDYQLVTLRTTGDDGGNAKKDPLDGVETGFLRSIGESIYLTFYAVANLNNALDEVREKRDALTNEVASNKATHQDYLKTMQAPAEVTKAIDALANYDLLAAETISSTATMKVTIPKGVKTVSRPSAKVTQEVVSANPTLATKAPKDLTIPGTQTTVVVKTPSNVVSQKITSTGRKTELMPGHFYAKQAVGDARLDVKSELSQVLTRNTPDGAYIYARDLNRRTINILPDYDNNFHHPLIFGGDTPDEADQAGQSAANNARFNVWNGAIAHALLFDTNAAWKKESCLRYLSTEALYQYNPTW